MMQIFFQVCFGVGLGYAVISFFIGHVIGGLFGGGADADASADAGLDSNIDAGVDTDLDLDLDLDIDVDLDLDAEPSFEINADAGAEPSGAHGSVAVSPFKPTVIAAFLVVFGGAGMIALPGLGLYLATTVSGAAGLVAGYAVFRLYTFLYKRQNTSAVARQSLIGAGAKVSEAIPQGSYGKITYYANGNTYTAPAKSENGDGIKRGSDVVIVSIVRNTYFVKQKNFQ